MTFGLGVESVWSAVSSVGLWFFQLDEDDGSFSWDGTMLRLHDMAKWHDGTMRWYDTMARWHNMAQWYNGMMSRYDTMVQCDGTMAQW